MQSLGKLRDLVSGWHWNDPVSELYRELFKPNMILDPTIDRTEILAELAWRQSNLVPPGYKDAANAHSGIGDLLIWKAILQIGKQRSCHLIFVSNDEKADWRYRSERKALNPRFELLDEYRRASGGKTLLIVSLAELLRESGATSRVIQEVREEEARKPTMVVQDINFEQAFENRATQAVKTWLDDSYPNSVQTRKMSPSRHYRLQGCG